MATDGVLQNALNALLGLPPVVPFAATTPSISILGHRISTLSSPTQCTAPPLPNIVNNSPIPQSARCARTESECCVSNDIGKISPKASKRGFVCQRRAQIAALREQDVPGSTNESVDKIQKADESVQKYLMDKGESEEGAKRAAVLFQNDKCLTPVFSATGGHGDSSASWCIAAKMEMFEGKFDQGGLLDAQHRWLLEQIFQQHSSIELAALQPKACNNIYMDSLHRALSDEACVFHCALCATSLVSFTQDGDVDASWVWPGTLCQAEQVQLSCGHSCCRSCMDSWSETVVTQHSGAVSCPVQSCKHTLQDDPSKRGGRQEEEIQELFSKEACETYIAHRQAPSPSSSGVGLRQSEQKLSLPKNPRENSMLVPLRPDDGPSARDRVASYDAQRKKTIAKQNIRLRKLLKKNRRRPTTPEQALIKAQRRAAYEVHRKATAGELQAELMRQSEASEFKVVSLGCCCHVNLALLNMSLRQEAYPFDNIRMSLKGLLHFIATQFLDFIPHASTDGMQSRQTYQGEYHSFWHDNLDSANDHAKYKRRTDRFLALGNLGKPLLFVFACNSSLEVSDGECLLESLRQLFGTGTVWVLLVVDGQKETQLMEVEGTDGHLWIYCMLWQNCEDQGSLFMEGVKKGVALFIKHLPFGPTTPQTPEDAIQSCATLEPRLIPYTGGDTRREKYRLRKFDHRRARSVVRPSKASPSCSDVDAQAQHDSPSLE